MSPSRAWSLVSVTTFAGVATLLLAAACESEPLPRLSDGPIGEARAGATLATPGFIETTVFSGHNNPTVVRFANDGRAFVAEKNGRIWVYDDLNDATPTLFVNLQTKVHDFWDRGLLGMTLDPEFPTKPYVYVLYAYDGDPGGASPKWGDVCPTPPGATADGCVVSGRLSRFAASGNVAGSETVLIEGWRQQYPSHATGQVEFGPDGALYASGGDGASFNFVDYGQDGNPINPLGDPPVAVGEAQTPPSAQGGALRSQSVRRPSGPVVLSGSVIRVDPQTGLGKADNPLASSNDANAQRVIAYGLRNPFRIAARPGKNEIWIADVGWNAWEEVNRLPIGGATALNFGWPCYEGAAKQPSYDNLDLTSCESLYAAGTATSPFFAYNHANKVSNSDGCGTGGSSVTGLAFYQGGAYPAAYKGALFFSDYSRRCIYVMEAGGGGDPDPATARSFHVDADGPVFLTTGPGGDIFYAALNSGTIQRITYLEPSAAFTASPQQGQAPLLVRFDGTSSVKPLPSDVLSYAWDLDGDGEFDDATEPDPAYLYDVVGEHAVRLKVTDQRGTANVSAPVTISATKEPPQVSTPPVVVIDTPSAALDWQVGDTIQFSGHATDAEDGVLAASALSWQIVLQHCPDGCHVHDVVSFEGVASGSFQAEDHEYPMYLEVILTATDSSGQKRSTRRALQPRTTSLVFDTEPSGLQLVVGSTIEKTPFVRRVLVGSQNSVAAEDVQSADGTNWKFVSWSDGGARAHTLPTASEATRYVATYAPTGGLMGQYYDQLAFAGTPLSRIDPTLDFNWLGQSPAPELQPDTFSIRWSGEVKADFAETYQFSTTSDDGVRVLIDGVTVIDHFNDHAPTIDNGTIALAVGWHPITVEYYENGGGAQLQLRWSSPSLPQAVVPESHLRAGCADGTCPSALACNADALCVPACDSKKCAATQHCTLTSSACVGKCSGFKCPTGDKCSNGLCVDACTGINCAVGKHCEAGKCVDDPPPVGEGGAGGVAGEGGAGGSQAGTAAISGSGGVAGSGMGGNGGVAGNDDVVGGSGTGGDSPIGMAGDQSGGQAGQAPTDTGESGTTGQVSAGNGGQDSSGVAGVPATGGGEGGASGSSAVAGMGGAAPGGTDSNGGPTSGTCSCRVVGGGSSSSGGVSLVGLLAIAALGRRRRRS